MLGVCVVFVHFGRSMVSIRCVPTRAERGIRLSSGFPPFWLQHFFQTNKHFKFMIHNTKMKIIF